MSPTNHSAPSSPSAVEYPTSTFPTFSLAHNKGNLFHRLSGVVGPHQHPVEESLDASSFTCLAQKRSEIFCCERNTQNYSNTNNNNWDSLDKCKENGKTVIQLLNSYTSSEVTVNDGFNNKLNSEACNYKSVQTIDSFVSDNQSLLQDKSDVQADTIADLQTAEDIRYLGVGGFSMWRGEKSPGGWVRKMGYAERFMTGSADFGVMSTVYSLWFNSKRTVTLETIRQACHIVARKMPHLRLRVAHRDGDLWWRESDDPTVDVKEMQSTDIINTYETLLKKRFDLENGPLWFVRYVNIDEENSEPKLSENEKYKHKFVCLFGFHHNFSDGTTNMKFCDVFLGVLNDLLLERAVDMKLEGKFAEPFHDRQADNMRSANMLKNNVWLFLYFCQRFYKVILSYGHYISNFTNLYHQPVEMKALTRIIQGELDEETTTNLLNRCRKERTTLNSAFTAAANMAMYKLLLARDESIDATTFGGIQTVNMRRYWTKEQAEDACGCHISTLDIRIDIKRSDLDDFWNYARKVQEIMNFELNVAKRGIKLISIGERLRIILYVNCFFEWAGLHSTNDSHYCVTNMGNLSKTFPGTGEVVEVTKLIRSVTCHYMPNLCQHTVHTFRGKLCYTLDYYTQKMERENAEKYAKALLDTLTDAINAAKKE